MINTAVILAAGEGSRLRKSTGKDIPKQLYPIAGEELISRVMWSLYNVGIQRFIIVLGWEGSRLVKKILPIKIPGTKMQFASNERWSTHGTGISLYTAKELVENERAFICVMGDHLFEPEIAERTIRSYETGQPWHGYIATDYRGNLPRIADGTRVKIDQLNYPQCPFVTEVGRNLVSYDAIETGLFVFTPLIFKSILRIEGATGDCDLCEAVDDYAHYIGMRSVDVYPWSWVNINDAESVRLAEENYRLCP